MNPGGLGAARIAVTLAPVAQAGASNVAITLGASKATAATVGIAASAVFVVAVIAVEEWWSHKQYVIENRPRLRRQIEAALNTFIEAALRDDGRFGSGIHEIRAQLKASIESQGTLLGIVTSRARRVLSI